jgi:hypothetical protein
MEDNVDGQTPGDDQTPADVYVYLPDEQQSLSVQVYEEGVGEAVDTEIKNKIVEAVATWARDFNERNDVAGRRAGRHCRRLALNASVIIEE